MTNPKQSLKNQKEKKTGTTSHSKLECAEFVRGSQSLPEAARACSSQAKNQTLPEFARAC